MSPPLGLPYIRKKLSPIVEDWGFFFLLYDVRMKGRAQPKQAI